MSPDVIATVVAVFGAAVTVVAGTVGAGAWMLKRLDAKFFHIDERFEKVDMRFERIERDLADLKLSVARLEGPLPRLLRP